MKKTAKSLLALTLAIATVFSLAACGKQDNPANTDNDRPADAPEYVYAAEYTSVRMPAAAASVSISPRAYTADGFYATSYEKVGENNPDGLTPEYEGQFDVYGYKLYFVGFDGAARELSDYEPLPVIENTENKSNYYSSSDLSGMAILQDGNLGIIETVYTSWWAGEGDGDGIMPRMGESYGSTNDYYIRVLDTDGKEISRARIDLGPDEYLNAYSMKADDKGNLVAASDMTIKAIAPDGSFAYIIELDSYCDGVTEMPDGRLAALYWGEQGMELAAIDTQSGALGEEIPLPNNAYGLMTGDDEYDFYYTSGINLYGYKIETEEQVKVLNWLSCDIDNDELGEVKVLSDGTVVGIITRWEEDKVTNELVSLTKVPYDSVPHKENITMAVMNLNWDTRKKIISFNRSNDKYRIEVSDYSEYNTEEDYSAGLNKLLTEIMSGKLPDILSLTNLPYTQLAAKGLLEDLYPYIDADSELKRDDFFPNVLTALEVDGGLYAVASSFSVYTALGATSVVGDTPGWTYDEFNAALASMPEGCEPFDSYTTQEQMLQTCLTMDMNQFVDWATGECSFDSPEFIELLEFTKQFPGEFDWDNYEWTEEDNTQNRIAQGKQMLMIASIYGVSDMQYNEIYFGSDGATYIGFPTSEGVGNAITLNESYAMSTACANKDGAWEFLRGFLTEKGQSEVYSIPTNLNSYNKLVKQEMEPIYRKDAEGNFILDENGEKIEESRGSINFPDGTVLEIYAMTQQQADKLFEAISSASKTYSYSGNDSIFEIVREETQAYYAEQKSAEEVARLIQSKANIFVNEQR